MFNFPFSILHPNMLLMLLAFPDMLYITSHSNFYALKVEEGTTIEGQKFTSDKSQLLMISSDPKNEKERGYSFISIIVEVDGWDCDIVEQE